MRGKRPPPQPQAPPRKSVLITMAGVRSSYHGSSVQSSSIGTLWYQALRVDPLTFTTWPIDQTEEGRDRILANILAAMQAGTNYQLDATTWLNGKQMVSVQKLN
jgi:hypothetical protein